jgi:hypothetical protein
MNNRKSKEEANMKAMTLVAAVAVVAVCGGSLAEEECVIHGLTFDEKENKVHIEWNTVTNRFIIEKGRHLGELKDGGSRCIGTSTNAHENSKDVARDDIDDAAFYRVRLGRQAINIPDPEFLRSVMNTLGTNKLAPTNVVYDVEVPWITNLNACMPGYPTNYTDRYSPSNAIGVECFSSLESLWIDGRGTYYGRQLQGLDVSACSNLGVLMMSGNLATNLVLPAGNRLFSLICDGNDLDFVGPCNAPLKILHCQSNPRLASLDVSACTNMESLSIFDTQVASVNLPYCPRLGQLFASNTKLTGLDTSRFPGLSQLTIFGTQVPSVDFSANPALWTINVSRTPITGVEIANKPVLYNFSAGEGPLSSLNITNCPKLATIWCPSAQLSSLDLSGLTNLVQLAVASNRLSRLVLPPVAKTMQVHCQNNLLTNLVLAAATGLSVLNCQTNLLAEIDISSNTNCKTVRAVCNPLSTIRVWWASETNKPSGLVLTYDGSPAIVYKP